MSETGAFVGGTAELWLPSGKVFLATSVDFTRAQALFRVDVLGNPESEEILVDGITYSMTAGAVWALASDWYEFGVAAEGGLNSVLLPAVTAVLRNNVDNTVATSMSGLKLESMRMTVTRGLAVMTNVSMQGTTQRKGQAST